jgi:hypothetical protein
MMFSVRALVFVVIVFLVNVSDGEDLKVGQDNKLSKLGCIGLIIKKRTELSENNS